MAVLRQAAAVAESLVPGCTRRERRQAQNVFELRATLIGIEHYASAAGARLERHGGDAVAGHALLMIERQCQEALTGSTATHEEGPHAHTDRDR